MDTRTAPEPDAIRGRRIDIGLKIGVLSRSQAIISLRRKVAHDRAPSDVAALTAAIRRWIVLRVVAGNAAAFSAHCSSSLEAPGHQV